MEELIEHFLWKSVGKGTQAPNIKEKFSCCHLVRPPIRVAWVSKGDGMRTGG